MKKIIVLMICLTGSLCFADRIGQLVNITVVKNVNPTGEANWQPVDIDKAPFDITIQTSDSQGVVTLKTPIPFLKNKIQNVPFNLKNVKAFFLTIPWEGWDGDATIHVKVTKGKDLISQMDLQDRNFEIKIKGIKNAETKSIDKKTNKPYIECKPDCGPGGCVQRCFDSVGQCDVQFSLYVDEATGRIWVNKEDRPYCDPNDNRLHLL